MQNNNLLTTPLGIQTLNSVSQYENAIIMQLLCHYFFQKCLSLIESWFEILVSKKVYIKNIYRAEIFLKIFAPKKC